jgi:threonine dehydrogenase-like Zn-dependent dehydrogenase
MRRILVSGPRTIEIRELPDPPLKPGWARMRAKLLGVSVGTELNTYRGGVNWHTGRELDTGLFHRDQQAGQWEYPAGVGYANVGVITAKADDVTHLEIGQTAFANLTHATTVTAPAERFRPVPAGVDPRKYLFFQLVRTAVNVVHHARPVLGDTVAIFGLGAVGLITLQVAKLAGATRVIAFDLLPKRREMALQMGADVAADPSQRDPAHVVRDANTGRGADVAIECAASVRALQDATRAVDRRGRVIMASMPNQPGMFHFGQEMHFSAISITGANVMQTPHDLGPQWNLERQEQLAVDLIPRLDLVPLITHEFAFHEAAKAYALLDQNPAEVISAVLRCDEA